MTVQQDRDPEPCSTHNQTQMYNTIRGASAKGKVLSGHVYVQIDEQWNGFVYVCDGQGSVSGTAASKEQVSSSLYLHHPAPWLTACLY